MVVRVVEVRDVVDDPLLVAVRLLEVDMPVEALSVLGTSDFAGRFSDDWSKLRKACSIGLLIRAGLVDERGRPSDGRASEGGVW